MQRQAVSPAKVQVPETGRGEPLAEPESSFMAARFGHDFANVRIHADARAAAQADRLDADAYTVGEDIVFGAGQWDPRSSRGQRLLAHELAHVVQQRRGGS